jgi:hypothetical protein
MKGGERRNKVKPKEERGLSGSGPPPDETEETRPDEVTGEGVEIVYVNGERQVWENGTRVSSDPYAGDKPAAYDLVSNPVSDLPAWQRALISPEEAMFAGWQAEAKNWEVIHGQGQYEPGEVAKWSPELRVAESISKDYLQQQAMDYIAMLGGLLPFTGAPEAYVGQHMGEVVSFEDYIIPRTFQQIPTHPPSSVSGDDVTIRYSGGQRLVMKNGEVVSADEWGGESPLPFPDQPYSGSNQLADITASFIDTALLGMGLLFGVKMGGAALPAFLMSQKLGGSIEDATKDVVEAIERQGNGGEPGTEGTTTPSTPTTPNVYTGYSAEEVQNLISSVLAEQNAAWSEYITAILAGVAGGASQNLPQIVQHTVYEQIPVYITPEAPAVAETAPRVQHGGGGAPWSVGPARKKKKKKKKKKTSRIALKESKANSEPGSPTQDMTHRGRSA